MAKLRLEFGWRNYERQLQKQAEPVKSSSSKNADKP